MGECGCCDVLLKGEEFSSCSAYRVNLIGEWWGYGGGSGANTVAGQRSYAELWPGQVAS